MLPSRLTLTIRAEERLKREKLSSGKAPNVFSRELFFRAIEEGITLGIDEEFTPGTMSMDKKTWLGETEKVTELIMSSLYPRHSDEERAKLWALLIDRVL